MPLLIMDGFGRNPLLIPATRDAVARIADLTVAELLQRCEMWWNRSRCLTFGLEALKMVQGLLVDSNLKLENLLSAG